MMDWKKNEHWKNLLNTTENDDRILVEGCDLCGAGKKSSRMRIQVFKQTDRD